jgi:hypothetical protein
VLPLSGRTPPSSGRGRRPGTIVPGNNPPTTRSTTNDANISAKRRKLNSDQAPSSSTRTTRPRPGAYALPEEDERDQSTAATRDGSVEDGVEPDELELPSHEPRQRTGQIPTLPSTLTEMVTESPANDPGSGHRMQVSLDEPTLQNLRLQDGLQDISLADVEHIASSPAERRKRKMGQATPKHSIPSTKRSPLHQPTKDDDGEIDELSPDQPRGRGRKPKQLAREKQSDLEVEEEEAAQYSAEEAEEIDDNEAAAVLNKSRGNGRPSNRGAASPDLDEPTPVVTKKRGKTRKITTPAQQRQPKPAPQANVKPVPKTSKRPPKSSQIRPGSPIPIPVHRFTKRLLYDDDEEDAAILNTEIPYIKRGGVNAIDVLSQVSHEIVGLGLDTVAEMGRKSDDPALRREYKTKWSAIEAFGRELQNRLLEYVSTSLQLISYHPC